MGWIGDWELPVLLGLGIYFLINGIIKPRAGSKAYPRLFTPKSNTNLALWNLHRITVRYGRQGFLIAGSLIVAFCITFPVGRFFRSESESLSRISKGVTALQPKTGPGMREVHGSGADKLLALVRTQMPTRADLDRENHAIVAAIHSLSVPGKSTPAHSSNGSLLFWGGLFFFVVGVILAALGCRSSSNPQMAERNHKLLRLGSVLALSGSLFSLGGVTLLKGVTFQFSPSRVVAQSRSANRAVELFQHGCVGPFIPGERRKVHAEDPCSLIEVEKSISRSEKEHNTLLVLFVVGSADKRPLSGRLKKDYGSNRGLAEARADWVRSRLLNWDPVRLPSGRVVATIRGPSVTGPVRDSQRYSPDRRVRVYGLWSKNNSGTDKQK